MKLVSLLPAATEIVCALGLRESLVGRSHECDFPEDVRPLPALTGARVDPSLTSARLDEEVRRIVAARAGYRTGGSDVYAHGAGAGNTGTTSPSTSTSTLA